MNEKQLKKIKYRDLALRETLNPKVSGYSLNKRFNNVDLPDPEGPEMTKNLAAVCIVLYVFFFF